jgi:hypothetical protein
MMGKKKILNEQELLEQIVDLKLELSKIKGKEGIYSREDYTRLLEQLKLQEEETTRIKQDYATIKKLYEQLKNEHIELNNICNELKQEKNQKQVKSKSGRKPLSKTIIERVHELKMNNKSVRDIQRTLEMEGVLISVGVIHKIIKGSNEK